MNELFPPGLDLAAALPPGIAMMLEVAVMLNSRSDHFIFCLELDFRAFICFFYIWSSPRGKLTSSKSKIVYAILLNEIPLLTPQYKNQTPSSDRGTWLLDHLLFLLYSGGGLSCGVGLSLVGCCIILDAVLFSFMGPGVDELVLYKSSSSEDEYDTWDRCFWGLFFLFLKVKFLIKGISSLGFSTFNWIGVSDFICIAIIYKKNDNLIIPSLRNTFTLLQCIQKTLTCRSISNMQ